MGKETHVLERFCHPNRNPLDKPFSQGEYSYATDGKIAIRIKRLSWIGELAKAPKMDCLPWNHKNVKTWSAWPHYDISKVCKCGTCGGTGIIQACPECDGEGSISLESDYNRYDFTCKTCDGKGDLPGDLAGGTPCEMCDRTGRDLTQTVAYGAGHIAISLLEKIKTLPEIQLSDVGDGIAPFMFVFRSGEGIVMGTSKE